MKPPRLLLACLLGAAVVAGCSAAQFAYNRLDFLARWEVGKYVDLDAAQRSRFDADFGAFWEWHRHSELPRYAAILRRIAARVDNPPDADEMAAWSEESGQMWNAALEHLLPSACALGSSLSDRQVRSLLDEADEDIDEYAEDEVEPPAAERRDKAERSLAKTLRSWLGPLTPEQKRRVHDWTHSRPSVAPQWLAFRRLWRQQLAATLATRAQPDFCPRLRELVLNGDALWSEEQRTAFAANRRRWLEWFAATATTLDAAQREHLRQRLSALADDFDSLAAPGKGG